MAGSVARSGRTVPAGSPSSDQTLAGTSSSDASPAVSTAASSDDATLAGSSYSGSASMEVSASGEDTLAGAHGRGYDVTGGGLPAPLRELTPGTHIASFIVEKRLGAGAMGLVYLARDPSLGRPVALKLLASPHADGRQRLLREAQAAAQLSHPNVVAVHQAGMWEEQVFLVMEYVDGGTLREWLAAAPRTPQQVLDAFTQAGRGLAAAHALGLVHRDFKPDNVLIGQDGRVRVSDFGLVGVSGDASEISMSGSGASSLEMELTRTGALLGTPAYMAPEQFEGARVDARADQFALCVALFEGLYGQRPFGGDTPANLLYAITHGEIAVPAEPRVPEATHRAIVRGLSSNPLARHASVDALLTALEPPRHRSHAAGVIAGVGGLAAIAGGVALAVFRPWEGDPADQTSAAAVDAEPPVDCEAARGQVTKHWNEERREAISAVFDSAGHRKGPEITKAVAQILDTYVESIAGMRVEACTARVEEVQSNEEFALRDHCLDDRLGRLDAFLAALEKDPELLTGATEFAVALDPITACGDLAALRSAPTPVTDEAKIEQLAELRRTWATAALLFESGRYVDAHVVADAGVQAARELDHPPTLVRLLTELIRSKFKLAHPDADDLIFETADLATTLRDRRREAMARILRVNTLMSTRDKGVFGPAVSAAQAAIERLGEPRYAARLDIQRAHIEFLTGNATAAGEIAAEALDRALAIEPLPVSIVADAETMLGFAHLQAGSLDEAAAVWSRAEARLMEHFGPEHSDLWPLIHGRGQVAAHRGDLVDAAEKTMVAAEAFERSHGVQAQLITLYGEIANHRRQLGHIQMARDALLRALEVAQEVHGKGRGEVVPLLQELSNLEWGAQRYPESRAYTERIREIFATGSPEDAALQRLLTMVGGKDRALADYDVQLANHWLVEEDWQQAIEAFERARDRYVEMAGTEDHAHVAFLESRIGNTYSELDQCDAVLEHLDKAAAIRKTLGSGRDEHAALDEISRASCSMRRGDVAEAHAWLDKAKLTISVLPEGEAAGARGYLQLERARVYKAEGRTDDAQREATAAQATFKALGGLYLGEADKAAELFPSP